MAEEGVVAEDTVGVDAVAREAAPQADDPARTRIRTSTGENLFVDAGAGTGKTSALVGRVVEQVLTEGVPLARTAVVTFTEKAGAELRDRLRAAFEQRAREANEAETDGAESPDRDRAEAALADLDSAAIGTLHSFAQRILASFPIQAGMPPLVEVLDEVGSSVAFETRWQQLWRGMLDDDALAEPLELALAAGVNADQLRSLARAFGNDWDLIDSHVLARPAGPFVVPETDALLRAATLFAESAAECTNPADRFLEITTQAAQYAETLRAARSDAERLAAVRAIAGLRAGYGSKKSWPDLPARKTQREHLAAMAQEVATGFTTAALRPLARWIAAAVREAAAERVASGTLEFHDLLVASRDLLRRDADARAALQEQYQRLLLDEFQDTDPIQIEIAVRIAAGADGDAPDWRDVALPPGSLFVVGDPKQSIYRFRRASIATYLEAGERIGARLALTTNFRSVPGVLDWVNAVFADIIQASPGAQPAYEPLVAHRTPAHREPTHSAIAEGEVAAQGGSAVGHSGTRDPGGPAVTLLGATPHPKGTRVPGMREAEADDVAAVIRHALAEGWQVRDRDTGSWRALTARDIAVLIPARTSLPFLESSLDRAGIAYRTESSSLVYQAEEIRSLLWAARAVADPADQLSCVAALRSALFGCGDDDLFIYKRDGGSFTVGAPVPEGLEEHPVGLAMEYLRRLARRSRWLTPADLLTELATAGRVLEAATLTQPSARARDAWGRVRFVIDQARAWSDVEHGGLREYLAWASHQGQDSARVAESLLPETDLDVVRIMTVHAAKGLEFGMVVLAGTTSHPRTPSGVRLLWGDRDYAVRLTKSIETNDFAEAAPLDEQMDSEERKRLLYVAATRAREHLVVSLHRAEGSRVATAAQIFTGAGALEVPGVACFDAEQAADGAGLDYAAGLSGPPGPGPEWETWRAETRAAVRRAGQPASRSASGLEGTEPEVVWAIAEAEAGLDRAVVPREVDAAEDDTFDEHAPVGDHGDGEPLPAEVIAGRAKGARDVDLAPWMKGRYGNLIGRAVHGTLQAIDGDATRLEEVARAQALAEGIGDLADVVAGFVRSALAHPVVSRALAGEHWSEVYVGAVEADGVVLEGFIDLLFRESPERGGGLVIVDYKTDTVRSEAERAERSRYYAPQLEAYVRALEAATGERASTELVFLGA